VNDVELRLRNEVWTPEGDEIVIDAAVVDARGVICADQGLIWTASGPGSLLKPLLYGLALDRGVIRSASQSVGGIRVRDAIAGSANR
jgi:hypothetical protein